MPGRIFYIDGLFFGSVPAAMKHVKQVNKGLWGEITPQAYKDLERWMKHAPCGSIIDGWWDVAWIFILNHKYPTDGGQEPYVDLHA